MIDDNTHLSDEDLLLLTDGELTEGDAVRARQHLAACWECRTRMGEVERTIADFVHAHHASLDSKLPPAAGPRALLKARLAESALTSPRKSWWGFCPLSISKRQWAFASAALFLAAILVWTGAHPGPRDARLSTQFERELIPNRSLTPGAARPVSREDVCKAKDNDPEWLVPAPVRRAALREYGIVDSQAKEFQLDYLIPPALGGIEDINNLWPEPYSETAWNAHAKDALEDRLHDLVCQGKLGLPDAQREIAADWIAAYKRYFHTD